MNATYTATLEALEVRRGLVAAGTPGPWLVHEMDTVFVGNQADGRTHGLWEIVYAGEPELSDLIPDAVQRERANAALIVAAVNAFAADTDALAGVLERHAPTSGSFTDLPVCDACSDFEERTERIWPCPDALAALTALGVEAN